MEMRNSNLPIHSAVSMRRNAACDVGVFSTNVHFSLRNQLFDSLLHFSNDLCRRDGVRLDVITLDYDVVATPPAIPSDEGNQTIIGLSFSVVILDAMAETTLRRFRPHRPLNGIPTCAVWSFCWLRLHHVLFQIVVRLFLKPLHLRDAFFVRCRRLLGDTKIELSFGIASGCCFFQFRNHFCKTLLEPY